MAESVPTASIRLLRGSDEPLFQRLRALLIERDVDLQTAILADFFPDDLDQKFGLAVTRDRQMIQFVVRGDVAEDWTERAFMPLAGLRVVRPKPPTTGRAAWNSRLPAASS